MLSAADSSRRSPAARRRAHSHDAVDAVPALPGEHGAPARSQMGFDLEPRYVCILGGTFPNRGCDNQLLGFGRLQILSLRLHGRMSSRLARTRWEETPRALYYTPNRWMIMIITLAVTARLLYGVWRIWHGWRTSGSDTSWLEAAGIAGSLAIGAVVLGYYVTYLAGVRWRLRRRDKT